MRFKKEVRLFMKGYDNWRKKKDITISVLRDQIRELRSQNEDLLDRLMARDIPELKTFTLPAFEQEKEEYKPEEDEDLAGEMVTIQE